MSSVARLNFRKVLDLPTWFRSGAQTIRPVST